MKRALALVMLAACSKPFGFDAGECKPNISGHRFLKDGSEAFTIVGREGDVCVVLHMREHAGHKEMETCRVPVTAATRSLPRVDPPVVLPGQCTVTDSTTGGLPDSRP